MQTGIYRHYAGKRYLVLGVGRHTENHEVLVCYVPLYEHPAGGPAMQFRPLSMWTEIVEHEGKKVQRFVFEGDVLAPKCRGCGKPLDPQNFSGIADGCECNGRRGLNHGLVPKNTCTCSQCDPEQTGATRKV